MIIKKNKKVWTEKSNDCVDKMLLGKTVKWNHRTRTFYQTVESRETDREFIKLNKELDYVTGKDLSDA